MSNAKTIWIINQYAGSPQHGMEYRHYYLAHELVKSGHNVTIISGSYSHLYTKLPNISGKFTEENIDGINYCWVNTPPYKRSTSFGRIWNMLVFAFRIFFLPTSKLNKPDAIIVSSPSLFPVLFANRMAKKYKAKFIFEVRDIWPLTLQELGNLSSLHPLVFIMQWFENFGYKKADKVVSVLPGAFLHMEKKGMRNDKFVFIPNGITVTETDQKGRETLEEIKILQGKFIVGYAGSMGVSNALDYLVDAAQLLRQHKEIVFVLIGKGEEKERLKEKAKKLPNVIFLNPVAKDQIAGVIQHFNVCYIGWKKEKLYRFGISANKIYEYMLASKPIVHSVSAFNDPVAEAHCGISVDPENASAIADALLKLSILPLTELETMGSKGRSFVLKNNTYEQLAKKLVSLIHDE